MSTVLLTGAAGGIGQATAQRLAAQGQRCILVGQDATALHALCAALPAVPQGAHLVRVADVTNIAQISALAQGLPALQAIINNAGVTDQSQRPLAQQDRHHWQRLLDINLNAPAVLFNALRPCLQAGARIVNVSSGAGLHAIPWRGAYSPSKAGLIAQTRAVARAYPAYHFHVLCPGFVETPLVKALMASGRLQPESAVAKIPLGRLASAEEMACALTFLASPHANALGAEPLCVDGGTSVFGGSHSYAACAPPALSCNTPLALNVHGTWRGELPTSTTGYKAVLDTTVYASAPGQRFKAALAAAQRFLRSDATSLTLLLPRDHTSDWTHVGDIAATRMLVATLACEWGSNARRINAIETTLEDASALWPVLHFVAGAQAQYLTGQTLCLHPQT